MLQTHSKEVIQDQRWLSKIFERYYNPGENNETVFKHLKNKTGWAKRKSEDIW